MTISAARLNKLLSLAKQKEDRSANDLATLVKKRKAESDRLEMIKNYALEYVGSGDFQDGKSLETVQNHRRFLNQLDDLAVDQKKKLEAVEANMDLFYQAWLKEKNRRQTIEDSRDDAQNRELQDADQREQKIIDDLFRRNPNLDFTD